MLQHFIDTANIFDATGATIINSQEVTELLSQPPAISARNDITDMIVVGGEQDIDTESNSSIAEDSIDEISEDIYLPEEDDDSCDEQEADQHLTQDALEYLDNLDISRLSP